MSTADNDPRSQIRCVSCHHLVSMHSDNNGCFCSIVDDSSNLVRCSCVYNISNIMTYSGAPTYNPNIQESNASETRELLKLLNSVPGQRELLQTSLDMLATIKLDILSYEEKQQLIKNMQTLRDNINDIMYNNHLLDE